MADDSGARGAELMAEGAARLVDGVERLGADWVVARVRFVVDAWGRLTAERRAATMDAARAAGESGSNRVARELRELFELDPRAQRATPLQIIRSLRREVTMVLANAGVPEVERDSYDARAFPDDVYGVVPKSVVELGDDDLGGALLAWGLGKSQFLRGEGSQEISG